MSANKVYKVVAIGCVHVPEHDPDVLSCFMKFCNDYKPHGLILGGDFMEMGSVSPWEPQSTYKPKLELEVETGKSVLEQFNASNRFTSRWYILGNHEDWLPQYVIRHPEQEGKNMTLRSQLELAKYGYDLIPLNDVLSIGDASFTHGLYTNDHHSKKTLMAFGSNIYYWHTHDKQSYTITTLKGIKEGMSLGCARRLDAPFLRNKPTNWVHAFGIFEFRQHGSYTQYVPVIINKSFSFGGRIYNA